MRAFVCGARYRCFYREPLGSATRAHATVISIVPSGQVVFVAAYQTLACLANFRLCRWHESQRECSLWTTDYGLWTVDFRFLHTSHNIIPVATPPKCAIAETWPRPFICSHNTML